MAEITTLEGPYLRVRIVGQARVTALGRAWNEPQIHKWLIWKAMPIFTAKCARYFVQELKKRTPPDVTGELRRAISWRASWKRKGVKHPIYRGYIGIYGLPGKKLVETEIGGNPKVYAWSVEFGVAPQNIRWFSDTAIRRVEYWAEKKGIVFQDPPLKRGCRKTGTEKGYVRTGRESRSWRAFFFGKRKYKGIQAQPFFYPTLKDPALLSYCREKLWNEVAAWMMQQANLVRRYPDVYRRLIGEPEEPIVVREVPGTTLGNFKVRGI